ncbi:MAG: hypothetical protein K6E34_10295 [Lachnospiraceae bacterium]|nr:hypothetical protein [Lachnospiraceae bacterium]
MKKLKKSAVLVLAVLLMLGTSGCAKKGICESCGKKAVLYRFTMTASFLGFGESETYKLCEDCMDEIIKGIDEDGMGLTSYSYEKNE